MATEAEPPPDFSASEGDGGEEVDNRKVVVVKIEEDGGQQPPLKSKSLEAVRGGGKSRGPVALTKDQLGELQRQLTVPSYICAGLPVPPVLLLHTRYVYSSNSPLAGSSPRSSNCSSTMEPEPGRCRRTDGKKWRCKNDVIPNTKYCERHIHRGCNRSRKLVEGSVSNPTASPSMTSKPPQQASSYETPPLLRPLPPSNSTKNIENLCEVSCNLTPSRSLDGYVAPEATMISSNSVRTKDTRAVSTPASKDVRPNSSDPTSHDKASTIVGLGSKPTHNLVTATIGCPKSEIIKKVEFTHTANPVDTAYSNGIGKEHTVVTSSSKVPSNSGFDPE